MTNFSQSKSNWPVPENCSRKNAFRSSRVRWLRARRGGSTLVEFALVVPILLLLSMMMVQYGILLNARLSLYHVSRNAGRRLAVTALNPGANLEISNYTLSVSRSFGLVLNSSDIGYYKLDNDTNNNNNPVAPENTTSNTTNRTQYSSMLMRISYDPAPKIFLPTKFFGVSIYRGDMIADNVIMIE